MTTRVDDYGVGDRVAFHLVDYMSNTGSLALYISTAVMAGVVLSLTSTDMAPTRTSDPTLKWQHPRHWVPLIYTISPDGAQTKDDLVYIRHEDILGKLPADMTREAIEEWLDT